MKYYEPKHFRASEFVPPNVYSVLAERSILVMDYRILKTADIIRDAFGRTLINTWVWGGNRKYSGFRDYACTEGTQFSQHRFGRAIDCILTIPATDARKEILKNPKHFQYITAMEDGVLWLHVDCRALSGDEIFLFKP